MLAAVRFASTCLHAAIASVLVLVLAAKPLQASNGARVRLGYDRSPSASSCVDESGMRDAVAARLGYDPFVDDARGSVVIELDKKEGDWRARIELDDPSSGGKGARALSSGEASCDDLVSAVSLAVALAIDPVSVGKARAEPPAAAAPPPEPQRKNDEDAPARSPGRAPVDRDQRATFFAALGGFVTAGAVPSVSIGPRVRAGAVWPKVSLAAEGIYVAPNDATSSVGRVQASILAGGLSPCLRVPIESVIADLCGRALFGALLGESSSAAISTPSTDPWVAVGLEVGLELPLTTAFRLRAHAGSLAALTRTFLRIRDQGRDVDVFRSSVFSGGAGLDLVVHFP